MFSDSSPSPTKNVDVILVFSPGCFYCVKFKPVYDAIRNYIHDFKDLADYNINFLRYEDGSGVRLPNHEKLPSYQGVPTVFLYYENKYSHVPHVIPNNEADKQELKRSVNEFLQNISNVLKSQETENKTTYLQIDTDENPSFKKGMSGGNVGGYGNDEDIYRDKYIKYKKKYLELKAKNKLR